MKTYKELLSELKGRKPKGDTVLNKKVKGIPVLITKEKGSLPFVVYIDGDRLDAFKSQKDAEKSAMQVVKELS